MNKSFLQIELSSWWILLILISAAGLSWFLYSKKNVPWNQYKNWLLAGLRFLGIVLLLFLLLSPSIRQITNTVEKPAIAIALDNSLSITSRSADTTLINQRIQSLKKSLEDANHEVKIISFNDSLNYTEKTTDLSKLISKANEALKDENYAALVLATDGIYNRGSSPLYKGYVTPVFTIGLGDTIPPKDLSISRTLYNKITFKGNQTPIRLELNQEGYSNREVVVSLGENGATLDKKNVRLRSKIQEVEFNVNSEEEGLRRLVASVTILEDESTIENNYSNIFMEVIDGRQKVLIVANAPHPDIKAIRSSLEETGNYETKLYIPSVNDGKPRDIYDVVIYHGAFTSGINYSPKENPGIWYILSSESAITSANKTVSYLNIERRGSQPDKVVGAFNPNFSKFKIEDYSAFEEYPPIEVPFGNYTISGPTEILMYQKLGSVKTQKPLMAVFDDGSQKSAVLVGQNVWRWKLQEAAVNGNADQFNNLITKTIQYLSTKNDKKQFRFVPRKNSFTSSESILFDTEVYNDIYERVYGNQIDINITNEAGQNQEFNFTDSEINSTFRAPRLEAGVYKYKAQTKVGEKIFTERGEFSIQKINTEYLTLKADHNLLKILSSKTAGEYVHFDESRQLEEILKSKSFKSIIKSEEERKDLSESWWYYLIIFLLFSSEWFLRKYWGGY